MIDEFINKNSCHQCGACASVCSKKAINFRKNEGGFVYPVVNKSDCNRCGSCLKVCPAKEKAFFVIRKRRCFALSLNDKKEQMESQSGGAFFSIATWAINNNGIVYGMSETTPGIIKTCRATSIADVQLMRKSKYIQGINDCFPNVMNDLKKGNLVLFSGLACCVQGLLNYLNFYHINTERLITIDLVCHGIGSPYLYERYRKMIEKKENSKIVNVVHRDKKGAGWVGCCTLELENGEKRHGQIMATLFSKGYFFDQKCLPCNYNTPYRNSTFTIGDFWQYQSLKSHHSSEGLSYVICDNKGKKIIDVLINEGIVIAEEQDFESNVPYTLKYKTMETKKHRFWRNFFYRHPAIAFHYALPMYRKVLRALRRSILKY